MTVPVYNQKLLFFVSNRLLFITFVIDFSEIFVKTLNVRLNRSTYFGLHLYWSSTFYGRIWTVSTSVSLTDWYTLEHGDSSALLFFSVTWYESTTILKKKSVLLMSHQRFWSILKRLSFHKQMVVCELSQGSQTDICTEVIPPQIRRCVNANPDLS